MQDPFIGEISLLSFNYAPVDWNLCDGTTLQVSQYQALFALIGYTYGGSGQSFQLPDLRGRVVVNQGAAPGLTAMTIGQKNGANTSTATGTGATVLVSANLPNHTHGLNGSAIATTNVRVGTMAVTGNVNTPNGNTLTSQTVNSYATIPTSGPTGSMGGVSATTTLSGTTGAVTGAPTTPQPVSVSFTSTPFSVMQPYLVLNYCIALYGLYPTRP
jgi:microcystin-dependent protein